MWVCQTLHTSNFNEFHSFLGPSLGICCCPQLTTPSSGGDCMEIHIPGPEFASMERPGKPHCPRVSAVRGGNGRCVWWACRHCQQRLILLSHPDKGTRLQTYYHVPQCIPFVDMEKAALASGQRSTLEAPAPVQYKSKAHTASANKKINTPPYPWHLTASSNNSNELSSLRGHITNLQHTMADVWATNQQLMGQVNMMRTTLEDMAMRHPVITTEQSQSSQEEGFRVPMQTSNRGWPPWQNKQTQPHRPRVA